MYRTTLKSVLPAALLLASANVFAAENDITLNGSKTTWADLVNSLNNPADASALKDAMDAANETLKDTPQTIDEIAAWLVDLQTQSKAFNTAYTRFLSNSKEVPTPVIYYELGTNFVTKAKTLFVTFIEGVDGYEPATVKQFAELVSNSETSENATDKITALQIYLGPDYTENDGYLVYEPEEGETFKAEAATIVSIINGAINDPALTAKYTTKVANPAYAEAKAAYDKAEAEYNAANDGKGTYNITLNGNITATTTIKNFNGTIDGNGYVITAPTATAPVFTDFTGTLSDAAVNGVFATTAKASKEGDNTYTNVALWNSRTNKGSYYGEDGKAVTSATSLGAIAYNGREYFGVDGRALVQVEENNKVYEINVYENGVEGETYYYVTCEGDKFYDVNSSYDEITVAPNTFVKSSTDDLTATNVFYTDTEGSYASNVVITDGVDFSCPVTMNAEKVTYKRNFREGGNTLCLPFEVKASYFKGNTVVLSTFSKEEDGKLVFNETNKSVAAYKPMHVKATSTAETEISATYVDIVKTDATVTSVSENTAYGTMKASKYSEFTAADNVKLFGLTTNDQFQWAGSNSKDFPAFRMFIALEVPAEEANGPAQTISRGITFVEPMDEDMTGIESVEGDANGFSVAGGAGVITINSAVDCGNVAVYAIDGRVAANAYVTAGATSVNVPAGLYIVNGQKVIVK